MCGLVLSLEIVIIVQGGSKKDRTLRDGLKGGRLQHGQGTHKFSMPQDTETKIM